MRKRERTGAHLTVVENIASPNSITQKPPGGING